MFKILYVKENIKYSDQVVKIEINDEGVLADGVSLEENNGVYSFVYYKTTLFPFKGGILVQSNIIYSHKEIQEILENKAKYGAYYLLYNEIYFEKIEKKENISREIFLVAKKESKPTSVIKYISFNFIENYTTKDMFELLEKLRKYAVILLIIFNPKEKECGLLFIGNSEDYKIEKYINDFIELEEM